MDTKLFLDKEETDEKGAIETACIQICVFSSIKCVRSHWWLNDQLYVSASLLIFVGSTKVDCMFNPSESMERKMDRTSSLFKFREQPSLNVAEYPSGCEDNLQDFKRTMLSNKNIFTNLGMANSSIYKLTRWKASIANTPQSSKSVMTRSTGSSGYGHKNMRWIKV